MLTHYVWVVDEGEATLMHNKNVCDNDEDRDGLVHNKNGCDNDDD